MQHQEGTSDEYSSFPSKSAMTSPPFSPFHHHPHHHLAGGAASSDGGGGGRGIGPLDGGSPFSKSTNKQPEDAGGASFTTSQRHELERQNMVFNYLSAYNSAPFYRNPTTQMLGMDAEPWRCRRTDGKKWRCTKGIAPDKKFCERHVHKSRKCSRKHVEIQSNNINSSQQKDPPILENQTSIGWLMKGGTPLTPPSMISQVPTCTREQNQQQENDQDKQETIHWNPYMGNDYYPYFDPKLMTSSPQSSPPGPSIDAWPSDEIVNNKGYATARELPLYSLTLSVSGGDGVVEENEAEAMKPQWMMSNVSWLNSTGGPLGEALCPSNGGSNTTSNCSKGSYEESSHQFNFFG